MLLWTIVTPENEYEIEWNTHLKWNGATQMNMKHLKWNGATHNTHLKWICNRMNTKRKSIHKVMKRNTTMNHKQTEKKHTSKKKLTHTHEFWNEMKQHMNTINETSEMIYAIELIRNTNQIQSNEKKHHMTHTSRKKLTQSKQRQETKWKGYASINRCDDEWVNETSEILVYGSSTRCIGITTSPPPLTCRLGVRLPAGINRMNTKHSNEYVSNRNKHTQTNYEPTDNGKWNEATHIEWNIWICNRMNTKHKSIHKVMDMQ